MCMCVCVETSVYVEKPRSAACENAVRRLTTTFRKDPPRVRNTIIRYRTFATTMCTFDNESLLAIVQSFCGTPIPKRKVTLSHSGCVRTNAIPRIQSYISPFYISYGTICLLNATFSQVRPRVINRQVT